VSEKITLSSGAGMSRLRRLLVSALIVAVLAGCGFAVNSYFGDKNAAPLNTVAVTQGDIEMTVTSLGKLKPKEYVDVGTQVSGQLKKVNVGIGDRVSKGDLIAEIDATVYQTKIRTGKANLDSLRAQLAQLQAEASLARQRFTRNQGLLTERAISQETVDENQASLKVANAKVAALRAQIKAAEATLDGDIANLGYTRIHAPMAGTVVSQATLEGQTVNASQAAPVIVRVADLDTMTVWAQVAEADIGKVKAGAPAYFTTLGNTERRWKGTVRQVMPTPETVNDVVLYNVLVDVDNREQVLMTDMTVQIFFVLGEARNALLVPMAALQPAKGKDRSLYQARVATPDGIVTRTVKIGVSNRTTAAVESGLQAGDKVVLAQAVPSAASGGVNSRSGGRAMGPRL
jgi:macrolide-specific efflux system membrane fusion protein